MEIADVETPIRTISRAGWLIRGVGLGILGCALIWAAVSVSARAAEEMGSTFQIPRWDLAFVQLLFLLVGGVFTVIVLLALRGPDNRSGLLVGGSMPPLVLMLPFFDAFGPGIFKLSGWMAWAYSSSAQTAVAVALGVMVSTLVWQAVTNRRRPS
jgi:hypothetical protein